MVALLKAQGILHVSLYNADEAMLHNWVARNVIAHVPVTLVKFLQSTVLYLSSVVSRKELSARVCSVLGDSMVFMTSLKCSPHGLTVFVIFIDVAFV
ncbi:hypothetical protein GLYMA_16G147350v4 [Glycine max]|nr:hypothetical protein GLYMA_16G147350v4 [Glycine max]KAH1151465.1 hypothetical protein GYH30_045128 [Glycine max]